ncbi:MAG: aldehyde dehydrogenase family protein [Acidobacteria bacterium]|nr:aldehyde dehydrogenase family protein [Acidobacteriota bacterium]
MIHVPILRWGKPYQSLETTVVEHFATGEPVAEVSAATAGMVKRDLRKAARARAALREFSPAELAECARKAADLYMNGDLPIGDDVQTPNDFVRQQSATSGLPEAMCRANMDKLKFVLENLEEVLAALTRGLDLDTFARGWGDENGLLRSYQVQSPVVGMVLPSNSPGVHTLWMPILPLQVGLVMKPGSQEPWTPWRMSQALIAAGIPAEGIALYPGGHDVGGAILETCDRSLIFGGPQTIEQYAGDPRVQVHGPGFSKILIGDDVVDDWEQHLDLMVESVLLNGGRSCINCSSIWASRNTREIAAALAERLGPVNALPHDHPDAAIAAFTVPGQAKAISEQIDSMLASPAVEEATAATRDGERLVDEDRYGFVRPTVVRCDSPEAPLANSEYMFPFVSVVECEQDAMLRHIGPTLVGTAITGDEGFRGQLLESPEIDRLNFGPIPTTRLNWLQPHEGNIVDFLYRARAFQQA